MRSGKITQQFDGDKIFIPNGREWRIFCCECRLAHDLGLIKKRGGIEITVHMNRRATAGRRKVAHGNKSGASH